MSISHRLNGSRETEMKTKVPEPQKPEPDKQMVKATERIVQAAAAKGISQAKLERLVGLSGGSLSKVFNGERRSFDWQQMVKLTRIVGLSLDYLADDDRDRPEVSQPTPPGDLGPEEKVVLAAYRAAGLTADNAVDAMMRRRLANEVGGKGWRPTNDSSLEGPPDRSVVREAGGKHKGA